MSTSVEEQRARIRDVDIPNDVNGSFQRLSLAIPIESKNYTFISLFLSRVLNVPKPDTILASNRDSSGSSAVTTTPLEILSNVAFPSDLWLKDDIIVKDVKIKTSMLQDINAMIERELAASNENATLNFDENVLNYYDKLLNAYKVYDIPVRASVTSVYTPPDLSLREEEEEDRTSNGEDYVLDDSKSIKRTTSRQSSSHSQKTHNSNNNQTPATTVSNKHNSSSSLPTNKRGSALSRELNSHRKRFSTLLGYENGNGNSDHPTSEEEHKKQQTLNSLLAKSRIYNKIKKNRESSSSVNSNTSNPSSYSNRNSISTTNTTNSSTGSRRRGSSNYFAAPPDINESRFLAVQQAPLSPPFALLTGEQKVENRKSKYDYYIQLVKLMDASQVLVNFAIKSNSTKNENSEITTRFIEFIKKKVLKFIIIDISQMIMDYAQLKAYKFYNSR